MKKQAILFALLALLLVTLACGTNNEAALEAAAAATVEVELTSRAADSQATAELPAPTEEISQPPTADIPATMTAIPTESKPCNLVGFVSDVTVPDGSTLAPGQAFTKTWRLKNLGSCTWTTAYDLVFFSGDQMSGPASQALFNAGSVGPGQTVDVSVDLVSPDSDGHYVGNWKLRDQNNVLFELNNGNPFFVDINVLTPTAVPGGNGIIMPILPIMPPLLVLAPEFEIGAHTKFYCLVNPTVAIPIENTGSLNLESAEVTLYSGGSAIYSQVLNNPFYSSSTAPFPECMLQGKDYLGSGDSSWLRVHLSAFPLPGTNGSIVIKFCSGDNLGGLCKEKTRNFIW